jgi:putative SOS response-associated peptidase YedK
MCGRFLFHSSGHDVAEFFHLVNEPDILPRYNIAPTQTTTVIRATPDGRQAACMRWGLVPSWAKDLSAGSRAINARCETVAEKPAFRAAFRKRRCLVPANGFYEWQTAGRSKQPFVIRPSSDKVFAFAGLWETWRGDDSGPLDTFTILTTTANERTRPYHDRMPVIVTPLSFDTWLDASSPLAEVERLFVPIPAEALTATPVCKWVNDVRHEGPQCLNPPDAPSLFP